MNLAESTWLQARDAYARTDLAIVPVGAVEVYGPHLPMGSDGICANEMARRLGERLGAVVTPLVPVGCSQGLSAFPQTLWVSIPALRDYLQGICDCLIVNGIKRIFFINGHATNVQVIDEIARYLMARDVKAAEIDWWRFVHAMAGDLVETGERAKAHAAEEGTSVLLALRPDLVDKPCIAADKPRQHLGNRFPDVITYLPYTEYTQTGGTGDPTKGTPEKGEQIVARCLARMEQFLKEWSA